MSDRIRRDLCHGRAAGPTVAQPEGVAGQPHESPAYPSRQRAAASTARSRSRFALRRRDAMTALSPATRSPRRCSPTASTWSAARSSITARAASSATAARSRTRWSTVDRGGGRIDPNIRATRSSCRRPGARSARTTGRRSASMSARSTALLSPLFVGRLLLQDLHVAARLLGAGSTSRRSARAAGLGRAPAAPDPDRYQHRHAHCDVLVVGAGPAGLAAALAASEARRARHPRDEQAEMGGSLLHDATSTHRRQAGVGLARRGARRARRARQRHAAAAHHGLRLLRSQSRRPGAAAHRSSARSPHADLPRERLWQVRAERGGAGDRRASSARSCSPATTGRASCWPRPARLSSTATACVPGRRAVIVTTDASAYTAAADLQGGGRRGRRIVDVRPDSDCARGRPRLRARRLRGPGRRTPCSARAGASASRGLRRRADRRRRARRRRAALCLRLRRPVAAAGRRPCTCSRSRAASCASTTARRLRAGRLGAGRALGRRLPAAPIELADVPRRRLGRRRGRGGTRERAQVRGERDRTGFRPVRMLPACDGPGSAGAPSSTCRTTSPPRTSASPCARASESIEHVKRYTTTGMATDQGKTSQHERRWPSSPRRSASPCRRSARRPSACPIRRSPSARLPGRAAATLFDPVRTTPIHDWAAAHGAVFEDVGQWKRARYFPRARRGHARRRRPRMPGRARARRHLRRLHARQDRGRGPGRGRVPQPHLHQRLRAGSSPAAAATA